MNLKKSLPILIILSMFFVGCSNYQVRESSISLPNEATKQKTMTKVQNDINEIMDKNYEYVLSNLGEPNATSYLIDKKEADNLQTLSDIEGKVNVNLVYLKNVSNEDTNSSALILKIKDDKVNKVQIVDYSSSGISKTLRKSKILINFYTDGDVVNLNSLDNKNLEDFIGIDSNEMAKIVGNKKVSYDAYLFDKVDKSVNVYKLNDDSKLLVIFTENNKVSDIKILGNTSEVVGTIKDEVLDK